MKNKEKIDNDSEGDNTFSYITRQNLNSEHGIVTLMTLFSCIIKVHSVTLLSRSYWLIDSIVGCSHVHL